MNRSTVVAAALLLAAACDLNDAPVAVNTIPDKVMEVDSVETLVASHYFSDPDGDSLVYSATSTDLAGVLAAARIVGNTMSFVLKAREKGTATITLTAEDPEGLTAEQSFTVTVPNRPPTVKWPLADIRVAVDDRRTVSLADVFADPDGDPLVYAAASSNPAVATAAASGNSMVLAAASVGTTEVVVTATDDEDAMVADTVAVSVREEGFSLWIRYTDDVPEKVREHVTRAGRRWEDILSKTELPDQMAPDRATCLQINMSRLGEIDDHLIMVHTQDVDGASGVLAYATYCYVRDGDGTIFISATVIDSSDSDRLIEQDLLFDVVFHEMGHGLGFHPGYWDSREMLNRGGDPYFRGENALQAFDSAGGDDYDGNKVPVQRAVFAHWREEVFDTEIMSPFIDARNPISNITIQSMADLGYVVDPSEADEFVLPGSHPPESNRLDLSGDIVYSPVFVIDRRGGIVRRLDPEG